MNIPSQEKSMATAARHAWNYNIDFIGRMRGILWLSAVLTVLSLALLYGRGLNFGTDFAGGYEIEVHFPKPISEGTLRELLAPKELRDLRVQRFGLESENSFLILVREAQGALSYERAGELRQALLSMADGPEGIDDLSISESGDAFSVTFDRPVKRDALEHVLKTLGIAVKDIALETRGSQGAAKVFLPTLADDIASELKTRLDLPEGFNPLARVEFVGPQVGSELRNDGLLAVFYSLFFIFLYVAFRFDFLFSPGAIVATLHDVLLTMGFLSLFQVDFNLTVVTAILTLIGFSLNDTVVVFDRIRENAAKARSEGLRSVVNRSINETLSRTILTSGTVLLVTGALLVLGGPLIWSFSVTMFVGVVIGTYSSIAVASPVYILMKERSAVRAKATTKKQREEGSRKRAA